MPSHEYAGSELTDEERAVFSSVLDPGNSTALMRGFYDGEEVALIVGVNEEPSGMVSVYPLGMLFRPSDLDRLGDADGRPLEVRA